MDGPSGSPSRPAGFLDQARLQLSGRWAGLDWSDLACGPPADWPNALIHAIGLMLRSGFPMFIVWGAERTLLYNDAYITILGERHPQAFGQPFFSVWPEVEAVIAPVIDAAFDGKESFFEDLEVRLARSGPPGPAWFTFSYSPVFDEEGRAPGALCVCVETTRSVLAQQTAAAELVRRRAVEQELRQLSEARRLDAETARREADELHRAYFENAPDALFVIGVTPDEGFVVERLNPAHEASVGFRLEDVRGKRMEEFLPPELLEPILETYRRVVRTGEMYQYRQVFELNGQQQQHWDTSLVPVRNAQGRVVRITGSSRNVTAQVVAEETLRQVQKMDAVGQLTGGIAHDFNNLLGAVMGGFDLILRKPDDPERVRRLAVNGLAAAERGARLTSQLLAFSRAQKIERKVVSLSGVVGDMREMLQRTLGPQIILHSEHDGAPMPVLSDKVQLEMAVLNLAINARDAMPTGGNLTIGTHVRTIAGDPQLPDGPYVVLSVADTGAGMTEDVAARAFEPFFTTKDVGKGTGLGLSQVYSVALQAGGAARIASEVGTGTTVSLLLPLAAADASVTDLAPGTLDQFGPVRAKILVIDDDHDLRGMLVESLLSIGFDVVEAPDGASGLTALARETPDLVVIDFAMPGMNGADVAKAIRAKQPNLPIVIASGFSDTAAIEGVDGTPLPILRKPFRIDELQSLLAKSLKQPN